MARSTYTEAQSRTLSEVAHRPWPLPRVPWVMGQTWERLLFAHWRVPAEDLRPHVPSRLELEERDGSAWIAATPFRVEGLHLRGVPALAAVSRFLELNCRTYVRRGDRPGIWFFSLDASSRLAVQAARVSYALPYRYARIAFDGETFTADREGEDVAFSATYRGVGEPFEAAPGTLEHFLVERYCLYGAGGLTRADIHHLPWSLQEAEGAVEVDGLPPLPVEGDPLLHFAERQDVVIWPPVPVSTDRRPR